MSREMAPRILSCTTANDLLALHLFVDGKRKKKKEKKI